MTELYVSERNRMILNLAREGLYISEIARRVGLSRERVRVILNKYAPQLGVTVRHKTTALAHIPTNELFAVSPTELAQRFGVDRKVVYAERRRRRRINKSTVSGG